MGKVCSEVLVGEGTLSLKYPVAGAYVDVGYTDDGVVMETTTEHVDFHVMELTYPIKRVITREGTKFTCNLAQASLDNLNKAIPGAVLAGSVLSIGAGTIKEMQAKFVGTNPAGYARTIVMALCTATAGPTISFKKDKAIVPITIEALDDCSNEPVVLTDSTS